MLKIYTVVFNDGGWHQSLPRFTTVATNKEEAIEKVKSENKYYSNWDSYASEFKIDGYIIEIYDVLSYNRDKKNRRNL